MGTTSQVIKKMDVSLCIVIKSHYGGIISYHLSLLCARGTWHFLSISRIELPHVDATRKRLLVPGRAARCGLFASTETPCHQYQRNLRW